MKKEYEATKHHNLNFLMAIMYIFLMIIAYYATAEYQGGIPTIPVNIRYVVDVAVVGLACLWFLITFDLERLKLVYSLSSIFIIPLVGVECISMIIWLVRCQSTGFITRGTINIMCAILNILCVSAAYYLFEKKTVIYTFIAAATAMVIIMMDVIRRFGLAEFVGQYLALIMTFADNTGKAMEQMELHDLVHGMGLFLMYYLYGLIKHKKKEFWRLLGTFLFFSLGLKRIDFIAIILACIIGFIYDKLSDQLKAVFFTAILICLAAFIYGYLLLIKEGLYKPLMDSLGINTMSRDFIYDFYKDFYELSPLFLGYGIRYLFKLRIDYMATGRGIKAQNAPHNEFITHYIELGFWGFIYWMWSNTWYKVSMVKKRFGSASTTFLVMAVLYSFVTYMTDNTFFYYSINIAMYVTVFAYVDEHKCLT